MHIEVVACGYRPNSIEDVFGALGSGQRLHGDVSIGKDTLDCGGHRPGELSRALEGYGAGQANGEIGKVPVAGAANAHTVDLEHAIHPRDDLGDLRANSGGGSVEQAVDGATG